MGSGGLPARAYWLDLFTPKTWAEFLDAGGDVSGFREGRRGLVAKIKPGDYLLCYLTGVSRFVGLLEVTSEPYQDHAKIWSAEDFPLRLHVGRLAVLAPEHGVPIVELFPRLSLYPRRKSDNSWQGLVQGSPTRFGAADGELITAAILDAEANPIVRPFDPKKLLAKASPAKISHKPALPSPPAARPTDATEYGAAPGGPGLRAPENAGADLSGGEPANGDEEGGTALEVNAHTEIESILLRIGSAMGLELWIDPADRGKSHDGLRLGDVPGVLDALPLPFSAEVLKTIRRIDVLWLRDQMVVGAFEVKSTTSVYSGLLRMADLVAMNPNLTIPMFIVAPSSRRERVRQEIVRPTFSKLFHPPMAKRCRYVPFDRLRERFALLEQANLLGAIPPDAFLTSVSETVDQMVTVN